MGYVPNRAAQGLRGAPRDSVAVIIAGTSNAYYLDLMSGIQRTMQQKDVTVVLMDIAVNGVYDADLEDRVIQRLLESRMAGVISTLTLKPESLALLASWDLPIMFVDSSPPREAPHLPSVTTDNYNASLLVGEHLAQHGYKNWLFLVYPERWSTRFDRERGLRDAARQHGAEITVLESENDAAAARATLATYLDRAGPWPDVLIAGNNPLLLGALNLLRSRGTRVPDDLGVVGYDEFAWAPLIEPSLTVLNERSEEIGGLAAETLLEIIEEQSRAVKRGEAGAPEYLPRHQRQVPVDLLVRRSCGCHPPLDRTSDLVASGKASRSTTNHRTKKGPADRV
nr:LacI family DNA-binding transcriptional regulator [Rubellimicrobium aerolatum]